MADHIARHYFAAFRDSEHEVDTHSFKEEHPLRLLGRRLSVYGEEHDAWNFMEWFAEGSEASSSSSDARSSVGRSILQADEVPQQAEEDRDDSLAELWAGLWRLQGSDRLQRALPRLAQAVQKSCRAGRCRNPVEFLRREVDDVVAEVVQDLWFTELCLEDEHSSSESSKNFLHDRCSTSSTMGGGSESCTSSSIDTERLSEDAEVPTAEPSPSVRSSPSERPPWELEFASMAAADDLWQRLRERDLVGAEQVITATREEVGMALTDPKQPGSGRLSIFELVPGI
eukprot:TRINITY_DN17976_c0_g1_i2.p1 TRINITY_DN17976_c0_g1~~TRINITY_DN17976_c0_g1_i2.p1  ORF type:complete len:285 (-),score=58.14 TRINITY_DN17976_c0_g1_i2:148-1002(-)